MASASSSYPNEDVTVVALSPETLLNSSRFVCEICSKGFPRKQNLSLHGRAHNIPFALKTKAPSDPVSRKVYICPEPTCIHHNPSHAIGDFGGIRKHYLRKHDTEKKHKCATCSKAYGVESDLKSHSKVCAGKNYFCECGSQIPRGDFIAHQENCAARGHVGAGTSTTNNNSIIPTGSSISQYPQTLGMRDNTIRVHESSSRNLIGSQISYIQNQPIYYPFTPPYQSGLPRFGADQSSLMNNPNQFQPTSSTQFPPTSSTQYYQEGRQQNFDLAFYADLLTDRVPLPMNIGTHFGNVTGGSFMGEPSGSLNMTPGVHNLGLQGMLNPVVTGSSVGGGYEQGGYMGYGAQPYVPYGVGSTGMFTSEHQQQPPLQYVNNNAVDMNLHGALGNIYGNQEGGNSFFNGGSMLDPSNSFNVTPAGHNLGLNGMVDPVTGSSYMGSYEQGGYMDYSVGNEPFDYSGGYMDMLNYEYHHQQQGDH